LSQWDELNNYHSSANTANTATITASGVTSNNISLPATQNIDLSANQNINYQYNQFSPRNSARSQTSVRASSLGIFEDYGSTPRTTGASQMDANNFDVNNFDVNNFDQNNFDLPNFDLNYDANSDTNLNYGLALGASPRSVRSGFSSLYSGGRQRRGGGIRNKITAMAPIGGDRWDK
jgi:hypothetical protein